MTLPELRDAPQAVPTLTFCQSDSRVAGSHSVLKSHFLDYKEFKGIHGPPGITLLPVFKNCFVFFRNVSTGCLYVLGISLLLIIVITNSFPSLWLIFSLSVVSFHK